MRTRHFGLSFAAVLFYAIVALDASIEYLQHGIEGVYPTLGVGLVVSVVALGLVSIGTFWTTYKHNLQP